MSWKITPGTVTTVRDEGGRRRKYYNDVLNRLVKVEEMKWEWQSGDPVYATTTYDYNGRDQLTQINQGNRPRAFQYDGHGRLATRTTPEQGVMTYNYNQDDSVNWIKDARNVKTTFGYYPRGLVENITYDKGNATNIADTNDVEFEYDIAGNRTKMKEKWQGATQGTVNYTYDWLSRLTSEVRLINELPSQSNTFTFNYTYNQASQLKSMTNPFGSITNYVYDAAGAVAGVTGEGQNSAANYINSISYKAFGGVKNINDKLTENRTLTTENCYMVSNRSFFICADEALEGGYLLAHLGTLFGVGEAARARVFLDGGDVGHDVGTRDDGLLNGLEVMVFG